MSINKAIILGRLGKEPDLKYTPGGPAVCEFTLATSENWTDKAGQKQEKTEWHKVVVWGKLGELCSKHLSKGRQAYVEGRIQTRSWDAKDGTKRYTTEINASTVQFVDGFKKTNDTNDFMDQTKESYKVDTEKTFTENDIPF